MATRRRLQFVHGQALWMLGTILVLAVLNTLEYSVFFIVSLIGLFVVTELTAPINVTPRWRARLKWLLLLGALGFGYLVIRDILERLPSGLI